MNNALPKSTWRLILSDPQTGILNMAQDGAILEAVRNDLAPPTLRLYRWDPPCLSLGYSQAYQDVDLDRLADRGWDLVRRSSGGQAVLHTDELTYAVIGPDSDPRLAGSLMDSYQRLSSALFQALRSLGLPVEIHQGKDPRAYRQPVCFENPSDYEITVGGKKIIGNAQVRKKKGILQHGSLPLQGDLTRITQVLKYSNSRDRKQAAAAVLEKAQTVDSVLSRAVSWEDAAGAFQEAFQAELNLEFAPGGLSAWELDKARELAAEKYGNPDWTRGTLSRLDPESR